MAPTDYCTSNKNVETKLNLFPSAAKTYFGPDLAQQNRIYIK